MMFDIDIYLLAYFWGTMQIFHFIVIVKHKKWMDEHKKNAIQRSSETAELMVLHEASTAIQPSLSLRIYCMRLCSAPHEVRMALLD